MRLLVDAHGGDRTPEVILSSVERMARELPGVTLLVVGLPDLPTPKIPNVQHIVARSVIENTESPVQAVRGKPESSLVLSCSLLQKGKADVLLSAGNTGALLVAGSRLVGRIRGVSRPALSLWYPSLMADNAPPKLLLDVGANPDARPDHLFQYALLGSFYVSHVTGCRNPRVALLNLGTESNKGPERIRESHRLLAAEPRIRFVGNIEARDAMEDVCDVLVADGMNGNVLLKTTEGVARVAVQRLQRELLGHSTLWSRLAVFSLRNRLRALQEVMNYHQYGGAPLLGLSALIIKVHGSANEQAWTAAFQQASLLAERDVMRGMADVLATAGAVSLGGS
ncbi:phosphate acyltransferase PlsX [Pasteuria penetrans]|uniref:phosphate acyltransferase PlsX n=1 Tax=Pasteuria penetrans TaxID=86005 RepID=UPI000F9F527F|nr:phosphate acyltransferase PlsX [Pasteuria penetrans]